MITYQAKQTGNWNDPQTWNTAPPEPMSLGDIVNIPSNITVTIPAGLTVNCNNGELQIQGGLSIQGILNLTIENNTNNDSCLYLYSGSVTVQSGGQLNITSKGAEHNSIYYPVYGISLMSGTLTNNGQISMSCKTAYNPPFQPLGRGYGILIGSGSSMENNGSISISSLDPNGDGNGPTFGIINQGGALLNNANASITSVAPQEGAQTGGTIFIWQGGSFTNQGSFNNHGQFWNNGSLSNSGNITMAYPGASYQANGAPATLASATIDIPVQVQPGRPATGSTAAWGNGAAGPMCGNSNIIVASYESTAWYSGSGLNGILWKNSISPFAPVSGVASAGYNASLFIAVGPSRDQSNQNLIFNSTTGVGWSTYRLPVAFDGVLNAVAFGSAGFVAVGNSIEPANGAYATGGMDGTSWSYGTIAANIAPSDIAFGNGIYLAVDANNGTYTSADGTAWTQASSFAPALICFSETLGTFLGIVHNTGEVYTYNNGTWTHLATIDNGGVVFYLNDLMWSNETQLFVTVGTSGPQPANGQEPASAVFFSMDGVNWTGNLYASGYELQSVGYGMGVFTAGGYNACLLQMTVGS